MCLCLVFTVVSSPQSYVFSVSETWILSELPVSVVCQPYVPSTGIFGFPEEEEENNNLQTLILIQFAQEHGEKEYFFCCWVKTVAF